MSDANLYASFAKLLIAAATTAQGQASIVDLNLDLDNPDTGSGASVRLYELGDALDGLLVQVSLRLPKAIPTWNRINMRDKLRDRLNIISTRQHAEQAQAVAYDFQASDTPASTGEQFRYALTGSTVWRTRWESATVQHNSMTLKLFRN